MFGLKKKEKTPQQQLKEAYKETEKKFKAKMHYFIWDLPNSWDQQFISWTKNNPELWEQFKSSYIDFYKIDDDLSEIPDKEFRQLFITATNSFSSALSLEKDDFIKGSEINDFYTKAVENMKLVNELSNGAFLGIEKVIRKEQQTYVIQRSYFFWDGFRTISSHIRNEPGVLQSELYKKLKETHPREKVSSILYFAKLEGLVSREKSGRSYSLRMNTEKKINDLRRSKALSLKEYVLSNLYIENPAEVV